MDLTAFSQQVKYESIGSIGFLKTVLCKISFSKSVIQVVQGHHFNKLMQIFHLRECSEIVFNLLELEKHTNL